MIPSIFIYFDYREYLAEYYKRRKATDPAFSHRAFLKKAGIAGSVYLHRILNNERKLSQKFIPHFSLALDHTPREARYFRLMVLFRNEKKAARKEEHLREMLVLRYSTPELKIEDRKLRFFDKWYYPVLRELVVMADFGEDYHRMANLVVPAISPQQAEAAVRYMIENGFLRRNEKGAYLHAQAIITTGPEVNSTIVRKYHQQNLMQCAEALETIGREERDITSLTLGVSAQTLQVIKKELHAFRKRLLQLAKDDPHPASQVCLVGLQLLPRSRQDKENPQ
jgi:uncharacterized protein (TIGR02147 family)